MVPLKRRSLAPVGAVLVALTLLSLIVAPALVAAPAPARMLAQDTLRFGPMEFTVEPGEALSFPVENTGPVLPHTFTLFAEVNASVPVRNNTALQSYFLNNANLVHISLATGAQAQANFTAPTTEGIYVFVCMIPFHSAGGMHGNMTVSSAAPPPPPPGDAGIDPLLLGIVIAIVVLVIGAAVVFVIRRRG